MMFALEAFLCLLAGGTIGFLIAGLLTFSKVSGLYKEIESLKQSIVYREKMIEDISATLKIVVPLVADENYSDQEKAEIIRKAESLARGNVSHLRP